MKTILICLMAAFGLAAYADNQPAQCPKAKACKGDKTACCEAAKVSCPVAVAEKEITGSKIPVPVAKDGKIANSSAQTLKVQTIYEENVRTFGLGSPSSALARVPYVYWAGRR